MRNSIVASIFVKKTFFDPFWGTLGIKWGQQVTTVHLSKNTTEEAANMNRVIISHEKIDTVTHLGKITNFDPF